MGCRKAAPFYEVNMKYIDLFNEIQLSRDYNFDPATGANWRYRIDSKEKRIYVEMQETKTFQDWLNNLNIIPKTVKVNGKKITVPAGMYKVAEAVYRHVKEDWENGKFPTGYTWIFSGWSQGGAGAGILGFLMQGIVKGHLIMYGTPKYNLTEKSLKELYSCFHTVKEFLYDDDWIGCLIPLYKRGQTEDVLPHNPDNPKNLDQRHRVYGHCRYLHEEF